MRFHDDSSHLINIKESLGDYIHREVIPQFLVINSIDVCFYFPHVVRRIPIIYFSIKVQTKVFTLDRENYACGSCSRKNTNFMSKSSNTYFSFFIFEKSGSFCSDEGRQLKLEVLQKLRNILRWFGHPLLKNVGCMVRITKQMSLLLK